MCNIWVGVKSKFSFLKFDDGCVKKKKSTQERGFDYPFGNIVLICRLIKCDIQALTM